MPNATPQETLEMPRQDAAAPSDLKRDRILIVDDSPLSSEIIGACLSRAGYENLQFASNGHEALSLIENERPDLIILDLEMPVMDGYELCRHLRADRATRTLPVLIQSAHDSPAEFTRAFETGASDMVVKPVRKFELLARVRVHLENQRLLRQLTNYRDRVAQELEAARAIQQSLCPDPELIGAIEKSFDLCIDRHYEPSSELGGDIWGLIPVNLNLLAFFIADFSGHGVASALNTFRLHTLLSRLKFGPGDPAAALGELNAHLCTVMPTGSFATMLVGYVDVASETLTYASAGAPPPLYFCAEDKEGFRLCDSRGMPLGLRREASYQNHSLRFQPNSAIFAYSDVLIEMEGSEGALQEEGLLLLLESLRRQPRQECLLDAVVSEFRRTRGDALNDDLTAFCIARRDSATQMPSGEV